MDTVDKNQQENLESAKNLTKTVYILQAVGFFTVVPSIVAIFINHLKFSEVEGTWLESHFTWQMRTFWYSLFWAFFGLLTVFFVIGFFILLADYIWVIYRITKGWLCFNDKKAMYLNLSPVAPEKTLFNPEDKWF
ncbi:MAG: hypothetical protein NUW09_04185 [Deltaproteobacteria bacterium]|nr:hypothetical protein [Deltaproteobacteria bacterium]